MPAQAAAIKKVERTNSARQSIVGSKVCLFIFIVTPSLFNVAHVSDCCVRNRDSALIEPVGHQIRGCATASAAHKTMAIFVGMSGSFHLPKALRKFADAGGTRDSNEIQINVCLPTALAADY